MDYKLLGKRIREERIKLNLTQEQLAEKLNVSTAYIGFVERGQRGISLDTLVLLAKNLHVTTDYLLRDFVPEKGNMHIEMLSELLSNASDSEKEFIFSMAKLYFDYSENH